MVKKTVNYDAPEVYHFYFGDEGGQPGTIITFFPSSASRRGLRGGGQAGYTTFAVPVGALPYWEQRLRSFGVPVMKAFRFNEQYLQFSDRDGLSLELVERESGPNNGWSVDDITPDTAIKGFGGAVLFSSKWEETKKALENVMGLTYIGEDVNYARFQAAGPFGNVIDLPMRDIPSGAGGAGTTHHIAWRAQDDEEHGKWHEWVKEQGFHPTNIKNRNYFKALYFRERGGILFEIATDPPGFTVDEDLTRWGTIKASCLVRTGACPNRAGVGAYTSQTYRRGATRDIHRPEYPKRAGHIQAADRKRRSASGRFRYDIIGGWRAECGAVQLLFHCVEQSPLLSVSVQRKNGAPKDTARNAMQSGELVIHIVDEDTVAAVNETAANLPPDESELDRTRLTPVVSDVVKVPGVMESKIRMECVLEQVVTLDGGDQLPAADLLIARVVRFHVSEELYEHGRIDASKLKPVSRMAGNIYSTLGEMFEIERPV